MEETSEYGILGRHQPCSEDKIEVLSNTIERYHSSRDTCSPLYSESCSDGNRRSHIRESICVTSSSSKDPLKHDWMKELGSEVVQRPDAPVVQQSQSSQSNQSNPNPDHDDRMGNPLFAVTQVTRKVQEKRPVIRRSKHVLFMKKLLNMIER